MKRLGRRHNLFKKYKGTDIATIKCQGCGEQETRTIESLRDSLGHFKKVLCKTCSKKRIKYSWELLDKIYTIKKLSRT